MASVIQHKLFSITVVISACASPAGSGGAPTAAGAYPPDYERDVYAFEVSGETGEPYAHPFLGGLNQPRPQLVDVDADGDLDLFVQEYSNDLFYFERVGTDRVPEFIWRSDRYQDLEVGEWFRFADMDGDGDLDLLAEEKFSYLRYYRAEQGPDGLKFVLAADTLRDASDVPLFSDRQNIPNLTDLDCDGMLDLFIGRLTGTVTRYEETRRDPTGVPRFRLVTDRFEDIEIVANFGSLHGANTLTLADVDQDGDPDLFWGDFFEQGLLIIENTGSCARPVLRGEPIAFPEPEPVSTSGYNAPTFGDVDRDGDLDLVVGVIGGAFNPNRTTIDNLLYYEQVGTNSFELRTQRLLTNIDVGSESVPVLVDLDADGDLDLLVANKIDPADLQTSRIYEFENVGSAAAPRMEWRGAWDMRGSYHYYPAFGDLDGDGDLDVVMGTWNNYLAFYRNDGSAQSLDLVLADSVMIQLTRGSNATPALGDIDGDGDLDLFIGEASGTINFYRNIGTKQAPLFELESDEYADIDIGRRSSPTLIDIDHDGDLDLLIGTDAGPIEVFRNRGTAAIPDFVGEGPLPIDLPPLTVPVFADMDGDGDLDLLVGNTGGGVMYFKNNAR